MAADANIAAAARQLIESDGDYSVEIGGVRIERCDEYGKTATTIDLEQTRLDLAEVQRTLAAAEQRADTLAAAIADEKLIRTAINDPGQFLPRGDNYREPIGAWGARAVVAALSSRPVQPDRQRMSDEKDGGERFMRLDDVRCNLPRGHRGQHVHHRNGRRTVAWDHGYGEPLDDAEASS